MREFENLGRELLRGFGADDIKEFVSSEEGRRLEKMVDVEAAEKAVMSGDIEQMRAMVAQLLGTEEGRRLAERLSRLGK
jgi:hypothetical protein